jgi:hypothetical protein
VKRELARTVAPLRIEAYQGRSLHRCSFSSNPAFASEHSHSALANLLYSHRSATKQLTIGLHDGQAKWTLFDASQSLLDPRARK